MLLGIAEEQKESETIHPPYIDPPKGVPFWVPRLSLQAPEPAKFCRVSTTAFFQSILYLRVIIRAGTKKGLFSAVPFLRYVPYEGLYQYESILNNYF